MILLLGFRKSRAKVSGLPLLWIRHGCAKPGRRHCWESSVRQSRAEQAPCAQFWGCQPLSAEQAQDEPGLARAAAVLVHRAPSRSYFLWMLLSVLYFSFYDLRVPVVFPHPCTDCRQQGTPSAHEGIGECLQSAPHPPQLWILSPCKFSRDPCCWALPPGRHPSCDKPWHTPASHPSPTQHRAGKSTGAVNSSFS